MNTRTEAESRALEHSQELAVSCTEELAADLRKNGERFIVVVTVSAVYGRPVHLSEHDPYIDQNI